MSITTTRSNTSQPNKRHRRHPNNVTYHLLKCVSCGEEFTSVRSNTKTCGRQACRTLWRKIQAVESHSK